jgi:hypothetical protein
MSVDDPAGNVVVLEDVRRVADFDHARLGIVEVGSHWRGRCRDGKHCLKRERPEAP